MLSSIIQDCDEALDQYADSLEVNWVSVVPQVIIIIIIIITVLLISSIE